MDLLSSYGQVPSVLIHKTKLRSSPTMGSENGKYCHSDCCLHRQLSCNPSSRSSVGYTGRLCSSIWMTSLLSLRLCELFQLSARGLWAPLGSWIDVEAFQVCNLATRSQIPGKCSWPKWRRYRPEEGEGCERVDCFSKPSWVAGILRPGRVLQTVHTQVCRSGSAIETVNFQGGLIVVDRLEAAAFWPPDGSTYPSVPWPSQWVHPEHRRQQPRHESCPVSSLK